MKKLKRSERLVDITQKFLYNPHKLMPLSFFAARYQSAKSSISEDIAIVNELIKNEGIGELITLPGANGGVKFIPTISKTEAEKGMQKLYELLSNGERLLPGGYLYMSDILGHPEWIKYIGKMFASAFANQKIDTIITVETKGIPLAYATASYLNIPVVIVRRDSKVTEGSVVTINYVSGSTKRIQTMSLARRALKEGSNVLIIDDFMKAGGTINGMVALVQEFNANLKGIGVFVEVDGAQERLVEDYVSLAKLSEVDEKNKEIKLERGNFFN